MDASDKTVLQKELPYLQQYLTLESTIRAQIVAKSLLTPDSVTEIFHLKAHGERAEKLVFYLCRRDENAMTLFIQILHDTHHGFVAKRLSKARERALVVARRVDTPTPRLTQEARHGQTTDNDFQNPELQTVMAAPEFVDPEESRLQDLEKRIFERLSEERTQVYSIQSQMQEKDKCIQKLNKDVQDIQALLMKNREDSDKQYDELIQKHDDLIQKLKNVEKEKKRLEVENNSLKASKRDMDNQLQQLQQRLDNEKKSHATTKRSRRKPQTARGPRD